MIRALLIVFWVVSQGSSLYAQEVVPVLPVEFGPIYRSLGNEPKTATDPFREKQWYLENYGQPDENGQIGVPGADIALPAALGVWHPKHEVVLCIVDSGLDLNHEDINPEVLWSNPGETGIDENGLDRAKNKIDDDGNGFIDDVHGWNFVRDDNFIGEKHYHGTHVNGVISARSGNSLGIQGMCPHLKIMIVKIFGLGATATRDEIARGIRYAANNGAQIISCSWGGRYSNEKIREAIAHCNDKGILVCCAAGNSRANLEIEPDYPVSYDLPNQVIVSATDNRDSPSIFSSYGPMIDLAAPGTQIFSLMPKNRYRSMSGTSQACPMVAMAAAMLLAQNPELGYLELKKRLIATADKRISLKRWVPSAARLNIFNLLSNTQGEALPTIDVASWIEEPYSLESNHPYAYESNERWEIRVPGARFIRLHFSRFSFANNNDYLEIFDANGNTVEKLNTELGEIWTEAIPGEVARLHLFSNKIVNAWGFAIDRIAVGR